MKMFHNLSTRRSWLQQNALGLVTLGVHLPRHVSPQSLRSMSRDRGITPATRACVAAHAEQRDLAPWQTLAQQAVDSARAAGAQYADARLTRVVTHRYGVSANAPFLRSTEETIGVGIRALVQGYWGFSASAVVAPDEVVRLAHDAVGQAKENAKGLPWTIELGTMPVAKGTWTTPLRIDPFSISIEEKQDFILYWAQCAEAAGVDLWRGGLPSWLRFVRQEQVVATSEGSLFTQTLYETGGTIITELSPGTPLEGTQNVHGIGPAGAGWELFLDARIPEQFSSGQIKEELARKANIQRKPSTIGKYTLVCDGATMARIVENTLGVATQLDRALGYEANAGGTSFIDDPITMVGQLQVASPLVTLTADRSTPRDLATVKWDAEGVVPVPFPIIKNGVLVDFQTTREQAAWLAPYYQSRNQPVYSHGCAAAENAHVTPLQQMPNLALKPSDSAIGLEELVANVKNGILIENGSVGEVDFQARSGMLVGTMREIKNGKLGKGLVGGAVLYTSQDLWKAIQVVGGAATQAVVGSSSFTDFMEGDAELLQLFSNRKGQPLQVTSHTVRAAAATIANQALIDPSRKV